MLAAPQPTQTAQDSVQAQAWASESALTIEDRSGYGVAQRRRASIVAGGTSERPVQRTLDVEVTTTKGLGEEDAAKLQQVASTLNSLPFDQKTAVELLVETGKKGDPPLRVVPDEDGDDFAMIYLQAEYVKNSSRDQILQACFNALGSQVFRKTGGAGKVDGAQVKAVLDDCDALAKKTQFPTNQILAKLSELLLPQACEKVVKNKSESAAEVRAKSGKIAQAMNGLLEQLARENRSSYKWLDQLKSGGFDASSIRAGLEQFLSRRGSGGADDE